MMVVRQCILAFSYHELQLEYSTKTPHDVIKQRHAAGTHSCFVKQ